MDFVEKTVQAKVDNLHDVLDFVEQQLEAHEASMKVITITNISVEEMYANICMYAYENNPDGGDCKITISFEDDDVTITLIDSGIPFDPLAKVDPDVHAKLEDRDVGGLGIYMVKEYMDECNYERKDDQNIFMMRKKIK